MHSMHRHARGSGSQRTWAWGGLFFYLVECTLSIIYRNCPSSCADVHICTVYAVKEI